MLCTIIFCAEFLVRLTQIFVSQYKKSKRTFEELEPSDEEPSFSCDQAHHVKGILVNEKYKGWQRGESQYVKELNFTTTST